VGFDCFEVGFEDCESVLVLIGSVRLFVLGFPGLECGSVGVGGQVGILGSLGSCVEHVFDTAHEGDTC